MPEKFGSGVPSPEQKQESKEDIRKIFAKIKSLTKKRHDAYLECNHYIHGNFTDDMIGQERECPECTKDIALIPEIIAAASAIDENKIETIEDAEEVLKKLHYASPEWFFDSYEDSDFDDYQHGIEHETGEPSHEETLIEYTKEIVRGIKNKKPETFGSQLSEQALKLIEEETPKE